MHQSMHVSMIIIIMTIIKVPGPSEALAGLAYCSVLIL